MYAEEAIENLCIVRVQSLDKHIVYKHQLVLKIIVFQYLFEFRVKANDFLIWNLIGLLIILRTYMNSRYDNLYSYYFLPNIYFILCDFIIIFIRKAWSSITEFYFLINLNWLYYLYSYKKCPLGLIMIFSVTMNEVFVGKKSP